LFLFHCYCSLFCRGVNRSDRIMLSLYFLSYFFIGFGAEQIIVGCRFECGLYRTTYSDRKWSGSEPEADKDYRISKTYIHHCKQYKKVFRLGNH
jgi:hypothetical protein